MIRVTEVLQLIHQLRGKHISALVAGIAEIILSADKQILSIFFSRR